MTFSATSYDFTTFEDAGHYIGGEWSKSGTAHDVINPRHGKAMAREQDNICPPDAAC